MNPIGHRSQGDAHGLLGVPRGTRSYVPDRIISWCTLDHVTRLVRVAIAIV
jgi:hypothetical protein